jgi:hypothetical protein
MRTAKTAAVKAIDVVEPLLRPVAPAGGPRGCDFKALAQFTGFIADDTKIPAAHGARATGHCVSQPRAVPSAFVWSTSLHAWRSPTRVQLRGCREWRNRQLVSWEGRQAGRRVRESALTAGEQRIC